MNKLIRQAFTLIELLVVIAIVGILSGLIVVSMGGMTQKATIAKAQVFSNSLRNSLMTNLVSEWKFDGPTSIGSSATNSDVLDSWGSGNGQVNGTAITIKGDSDCIYGKCLDFNPTSSSNLSSLSNININQASSTITINYWIYRRNGVRYNGGTFTTSESAGLLTLSDQSYNVIIYHTLNSNYSWVRFYFNDSSMIENFFSLPGNIDNGWHLITLSYDGSNIKLFLDGNMTPSFAKSGSLKLATSWNVILANITTYWLNGKMDEIRIYNVAMSTSQIREQYYLGLNSLLANESVNAKEYSERINSIAINE